MPAGHALESVACGLVVSYTDCHIVHHALCLQMCIKGICVVKKISSPNASAYASVFALHSASVASISLENLIGVIVYSLIYAKSY